MMSKKEIILKRLIGLQLVSSASAGNNWLIKEKIQGFGGQTAAELILKGRGDAVLEYIERIGEGGYV